MPHSFLKWFCCFPATPLNSEESSTQTTSRSAEASSTTPSSLPTYDGAIDSEQRPPSLRVRSNTFNITTATARAVPRNPCRSPTRPSWSFSTLTLPTPTRHGQYNSYMASVAIPPKLDPLTRSKPQSTVETSSISSMTIAPGSSASAFTVWSRN